MKTRNTPSLIDVAKDFGREEQCLAYLEAMRWSEGVRCVKCGSNKISKFSTQDGTRKRKNRKTGEVEFVLVPSRHLYECLNPECRHQFSATANTIFHDTHLPLPTWFMAIALMVNAKKGLSAKQLQRDLHVAYRTAWYLSHRIRKAMEEGAAGFLTGTVECDETYIGGKYDRRRKRGPWEKQAVFGALQRRTEENSSKVRAFPIRTNSASLITGAVKGTVSVEADLLVTDEARAYKKIGKVFRHETVNHIALEYVRKGDPRNIHTNSIENFWSLFKRGVIGSYHQVSVKHLRRYLDEFTFRFNNRHAEDLFGLVVLNLAIAAGIRYEELTSTPLDSESSEEPF